MISLIYWVVAHPILTGIETKFMADYGRDWLLHGHAARLAIVVESRNVNGLKMFDPRMAWQVSSSIAIVAGTVSGSFILSCKSVLQSAHSWAHQCCRFHAYGRTRLQKRRLCHLPSYRYEFITFGNHNLVVNP